MILHEIFRQLDNPEFPVSWLNKKWPLRISIVLEPRILLAVVLGRGTCLRCMAKSLFGSSEEDDCFLSLASWKKDLHACAGIDTVPIGFIRTLDVSLCFFFGHTLVACMDHGSQWMVLVLEGFGRI